jgi:hypothetical protein
VTPFDFTQTLARVNERLHTAWTAAAALFTLTVLAVIARQVFGALSFELAEALIGTSLLGAVLAIGVARYICWQRDEVYDEIVLTRFRHVGGDPVRRYAQALTSLKRRRQFAGGIERFVETAGSGLPSPLPLNRAVVNEHAERLGHLAAALRSEDQTVTPEGMVLVRRLVCNGASSPLFAGVEAPPDDLGRVLDRIEYMLELHAHERTLALAA